MNSSIVDRRRRSRQPRPIAKRTGVASVELALILPFLLVMFVASVDFARVYYDAQIVADCAHAGALYAANPDLGDRTGYESVVQAALAGATNLSPQPTVTVTNGTDKLGHEYVEVSLSHTFQPMCAIVGPQEVNITRTSRARLYPAALED